MKVGIEGVNEKTMTDQNNGKYKVILNFSWLQLVD